MKLCKASYSDLHVHVTAGSSEIVDVSFLAKKVKCIFDKAMGSDDSILLYKTDE